MYAAEVRARSGGGVLRPGSEPMAGIEHGFGGAGGAGGNDAGAVPGVQAGAWLAFLPIVVVILTTFVGILLTGRASLPEGERTLSAMFGNGDSYSALLWAGALGSLVAVGTSVATRVLTLGHAVAAWVDGIRAMTVAMIILTLAWAIGAVCGDLGTADVLVGALGDRFPAGLLPAAVFVLSAVVSFSTGTSWGTMAILVPLVVPLSHAVSAGSESALVGAVSGVLAGSVFGDHCSPISDTTVLSSLASGADHIDHVRTQLPYALVAGVIALVAGDIATACGLSVWIALPLGLALVFGVVRIVGRRVPG
jgi:Na+/H+ antiporter NhaC